MDQQYPTSSHRTILAAAASTLFLLATATAGFAPMKNPPCRISVPRPNVLSSNTQLTTNVNSPIINAMTPHDGSSFPLFLSSKNNNRDGKEEDNEEDVDDDDDDDEISLYEQFASSEFTPPNSTPSNKSKSILLRSSLPTAAIDWGGEYDTLRSRIQDAKQGNVGPSQALFRILSSESPNEAIVNFVSQATPEVVTAMSSAVSGLLGSLASPGLGGIGGGGGMETIVKANGETLGKLCFQLQMTGYMFRNAEYVLALKELMNIRGSAGLEDYKRAFDKLDRNGSGYIERQEVKDLLVDVYGGEEELPSFEVEAFVEFFDSNGDGKISWDEFEKGLGVVADQKKRQERNGKDARRLVGSVEEEEEEEEDNDGDYNVMGEPTVSGTIQVEMKNGKVIQVEAKEYIQELKKEAEALKSALLRESGMVDNDKPKNAASSSSSMNSTMDPAPREAGGISAYIASLQGDIQSLTKGISPEVVDAMKLLVDFVLDGGTSGKGKKRKSNQQLEMEIPGSALQQLALWQLVLGYKLREAEATGEYKKMLE